jgi:predicted HicB family RNase H-like nuclease
MEGNVPDDTRIPLFVRVPADLKDEAGEAAYQERMSVSRYVEEAIRDRLRRRREVPIEAE